MSANFLTLQQFLNLKDATSRKVLEHLLNNEHIIFKSILSAFEREPDEKFRVIETLLFLVQFKLNDPERLIFIKGWQDVNRSNQIALMFKQLFKDKTIINTLNLLNAELEFLSQATIDKIKDYKFQSSEFYKRLKTKSTPHLIYFSTNLNRIQIEKLYNELIYNKFIDGKSTDQVPKEANRTCKMFYQLFFPPLLSDFEFESIKWLLINNKNNKPNKIALFQLFKGMMEYYPSPKFPLIEFIHGKDLFQILENNFSDQYGNSLGKFTHSNTLNPKQFQPEYLKTFQNIFEKIL